MMEKVNPFKNSANFNVPTSLPIEGQKVPAVDGQRLHQQSAEALNEVDGLPEDGQVHSYEGFRKLFLQHWHSTITYCAVFWSFGMCVAFLGPTLLDLGCITSSDMRAISWVFLAQLLCSLIGASMAGYLVQRVDANYILLVNTTLLPICMFLIPFCRALGTLAFILAVMGFNMGFIDCIANLQMINVYGEAVAPFLHALHFCYGMGAFVSPMIAEPYLLNEDCSIFIDTDNDTRGFNSIIQPSGDVFINDTNLPAETLKEAQQMTHVRYAFWIMAAVQAPIAGLVLSLAHRMRSRGWKLGHQELGEPDWKTSTAAVPEEALSPNHRALSNEYGSVGKSLTSTGNEKNGVPPGQSKSSTQTDRGPVTIPKGIPFASENKQLMFITAGAAGLLFIYDGLQSSYGGYVYSYAVKSIADLNKTEGAYLNALFWGMFALGRLLSIFLATKFTSAFMLLCNIMGCLMSMTLMLLLRHSHAILYIGTAVFGMFLSSVAPTTISLAEQYIDITSSITSMLVVIAALGEMICPVIVGNMFVTLGPGSFLGFGDVMCFLSVVVYCAVWIVGRTTPKHIANTNSSFVWCRMCCIRKNPGQLPQVQHVKYLRKHESENSNIEMNLVSENREKS